MAIKNSISPSRRYRVIMTSEDGERVDKTVTLPVNLPNNSATVEIWYHKYMPEGHLVLDIEPEENAEAEAEMLAAKYPTIAEAKADHDHVGYGDSLEYVGEDEPTEEERITLRNKPTVAELWELADEKAKEDEDDGRTVNDESDNSPKAEM